MATRKRNNNIILLVIIAIIIAITAGIFTCFPILNDFFQPFEPDNEIVDYGSFSVHFIDVGQGDCTLIISDDGNMLIDAGENGCETIILDYLAEQSVGTLKYFVATHPHTDHIGGAKEVIENITIENIIMPKLSASNTPTTKTYEDMLKAIQKSSAKVISAKPGSIYSFGNVEFMIMSPFEQDNNLNNMSVSLKLTYREYSFMFSGDAEKEVENQMLEAGYDLSADVYKAAHHASSTSNSKNYLKAINPKYAVISCSADNSYGHPHDEVIELFEKANVEYYSTYEYGNIIFTLKNDELVMHTIKNENRK